MPKSARGSERGQAAAAARRDVPRRGGFTLIELLVVIAIIAIGSAIGGLALRDPQATQLEREAARLVALLESARSEARAGGLAIRWQPRANADAADTPDFDFIGLPAALAFPSRWLQRRVHADVVGAPAVALGPEPLIGAQRIVLRLGERRIVLATDGLQPFSVTNDERVVVAR